MKRTTLFIVTLFLLLGTATAKPVDVSTAARVATQVLKKEVVDATPKHFTECYLFVGADGKGFALVAADDCVRPLLAYSMDGAFDPGQMPDGVSAWIDGYRRETAAVVAAGIAPSAEVQAMWKGALGAKNGNSVAPLMTTRWGQAPYYNQYSPYDSIDSTRCPTGCVATAMAQIMRYWEYPAIGWGSHTYSHPRYGTLSATFDTTHYRWDLMPDTLDALCDSLEREAVATLMYHAGVAVNMNYGPRSSGAQDLSSGFLDFPCAENALKTYFRYNPMLAGRSKAFYSDAAWDALLRTELDAGQPVLYCGSDAAAGGHAFVVDGYDTLGMFHVNWGWGGRFDAFYTIDSLSPGAGSLGGRALYTFNRRNSAITGIYPFDMPVDSAVTVNIASNDTTMGIIVGNGTYLSYDTVSIVPQAAEGCRYAGMKDGYRNIPLSFLAVADVSDTALFERIEGDTVQYAYDHHTQSWRDDYGNTTAWGIRIPASLRNARQLLEVQMYATVEGDYTLNIYQGDTINEAAPVYTHTYYIDGELGWRTLELDSVLTFYRKQTLWITVSMTDTNRTFPLACTYYCGNEDGSYYRLPEGWRPYPQQGVYYTWMLRAVFDPRTSYHVGASPNDINLGDITNMGWYYPGDTVMLFAIPKLHCEFINWSNGSNANPLSFILTRDTAFIANFARMQGIDDVEGSELKVVTSGLDLTVYNPAGVEVELCDLTGRTLATSHLSIFNFQFPISGVYFLRAEGYPTRKIIILK